MCTRQEVELLDEAVELHDQAADMTLKKHGREAYDMSRHRLHSGHGCPRKGEARQRGPSGSDDAHLHLIKAAAHQLALLNLLAPGRGRPTALLGAFAPTSAIERLRRTLAEHLTVFARESA